MEEGKPDLAARTCTPCQGGAVPLAAEQVAAFLPSIPAWELTGEVISRRFEFKNYCQTMAFVNAVAWIAQSQGHHPDLEVSYRSCRVSYTTHAIGGLSENDFICAARLDALLT